MINIYGKGGHGKMILNMIKNDTEKRWIVEGLYNDDDYALANNSNHWIIGIGNNAIRKTIVSRNSFKYITLDFSIYQDATSIGEGCFLAPGSVIQHNVKIGSHTIINTSASIDHDCTIGNFVHIAPNSTLCGDITIGDGTLIGAGSVIISGINIGKNCIIGAGSVVIRDVPDNTKVYGNPAKTA